GTIAGEDVFKLYDTFGFPVDLTELMARERGYLVDIAGFDAALDSQRKMSQEERKSRKLSVAADELSDLSSWTEDGRRKVSEGGVFVGYSTTSVSTAVVGIKELADGQVAVMLAESPFYAES